MDGIHVRIENHCLHITEVTVTVEWTREYVFRKPTEEELAHCPPIFTCFVCGRKTKKDHLAGEAAEQRVCRECSPHVTNWDVGRLVVWDIRHGYKGYVRNW